MYKYYFKRSFFFIFLIFLLASLNQRLFADNSILTTTEEFVFKQAPGFSADNTYSSIWHFKNSTYIVWVDTNYRAQITQVTNGKANTVPLDENADYLVQADGHHRFSLGVDKLGYIHVTGDMHNYGDLTTGVITPYPTRYQKKKILYWRSNKPEDITAKFSFKGDSYDTAMSGSGWLLGRFFTDNNGELFYTSQVHAFEANSILEKMAVGLYKYDTSKQAWTTIGDIAPVTDPYLSHVFPVFYWEKSGINGAWFQNYQANFKFDKQNRMYFGITGTTDNTKSGANRLLFGMSEDGGLTWKRANGTLISGFPIRGIDGLPNCADVVLDTGSTTDFLEPMPGLIIDKNNTPGLLVRNKWRIWDGRAWTLNNKVNFDTMLTANMGYKTPANTLVFNATSWGKILRTTDFATPPQGYDFVNYGTMRVVDEFALKQEGTIYGLSTKGTNEVALKTTIQAAPLPIGWANQDIDDAVYNYLGNAGFLNNQFVLTTYGAGIGNQNDSIHLAYKKMSGDGVITARITQIMTNGSAGVMMRESLDSNAKSVAQYINMNSNPTLAVFLTRSTVGNWPSNETKVNGVTLPYWVRISRVGDTFTGFISADGQTWKQTASQVIPMNKDLYVGLEDDSRGHHWYMTSATFDNVTPPQDICNTSTPTIVIAPETLTTTDLLPVNAVVSIKNNDPSTCPQRLFSLSANTREYYLRSLMEPYNIRLLPGQTAKSLLTLTPATGLKLGNYTVSVSDQSGGTGKLTFIYATAGEMVVQTTSDKPVYERKATSYNASLKASVLINNKLQANVPLVGTLTWPDGKSQSLSTTSGSGTRSFFQDITATSEVGLYNFSVTATYENKKISNNVMFTVR